MDAYQVRRSLAEKESSYSIDGGDLVRSIEAREVERIRLDDVRRVHLAYQPAGFIPRWVCSVAGPSGRIWLPSASYVSFGRVTDQRVAFRSFVEALHGAIAARPAAAPVEFVQGGALSSFGALAMFIVLALMGVLLVMGALGSMMDGAGLAAASWALLPLIVVSYAARMVWPIWSRNRRRVYAPSSLPTNFAAG